MTYWFLAEVDGDRETAHAAPKGGKVTFCGQSITFPKGAGEPTCAECSAALPDADPVPGMTQRLDKTLSTIRDDA